MLPGATLEEFRRCSHDVVVHERHRALDGTVVYERSHCRVCGTTDVEETLCAGFLKAYDSDDAFD